MTLVMRKRRLHFIIKLQSSSLRSDVNNIFSKYGDIASTTTSPLLSTYSPFFTFYTVYDKETHLISNVVSASTLKEISTRFIPHKPTHILTRTLINFHSFKQFVSLTEAAPILIFKHTGVEEDGSVSESD